MQDTPRVQVKAATRKALDGAVAKGGKFEIVGQMVAGKLELHHEAIGELQRRFPDQRVVFVAMNAPFDADKAVA